MNKFLYNPKTVVWDIIFSLALFSISFIGVLGVIWVISGVAPHYPTMPKDIPGLLLGMSLLLAALGFDYIAIRTLRSRPIQDP